MRLLGAEWMKLVRMPILWIFIGICMLLNLLLAASGTRFANDWNAASEIISRYGVRPDNVQVEEVAAEHNGNASMRRIADALPDLSNVFSSYDLSGLADFYVGIVGDSPGAASLMERKYAALEERRAHLADTEAALDIYAGPATKDAHQFLFGTLVRTILCEGIVTGCVSMLCLLGYENFRKTAGMTASSRTGRQLQRTKVLAGVLWTAAVYVSLFVTAVLMLSAFWRLGDVLASNVSSGFNYYVDMLVRRPFLTWADFSAGEYLVAVLLLGSALCVVFSLIAAGFGILLKNTYTAVLGCALFLGLLSCGQALAAQTDHWTAYAILAFQPTSTLLSVNGWFTELGLCAFVPWQETASTMLCLALGVMATFLALRLSYRKDLTA